jgi:hypothetical protein
VSLLRVLALRGLPMSDAQRAQIAACDDAATLERWLDRAPCRGENNVVGIPAAALRGGDYGAGPRGGVFALDLSAAPTFAAAPVGFRCVIPR